MKLLLAATAIILFSIFSTSCNKDSVNTSQASFSTIQYNWTFVKEIDKGTGGGAIYVDTIKGVPGDYYNFMTNGKLATKVNLRMDTFNYNLIQLNKQVVITGTYSRPDTFDIQVINNTNLQLFNKYTSGSQITQRTIFLTR